METAIKNKTGRFEVFCICVYLILTFFEPYLNNVIGAIGKYYIFFLMGVILFNTKKIVLDQMHLLYLLWLVYKIISLLWSSDWTIPQLHFISQIGMVGLLICMTLKKYNEKDNNYFILCTWFSSALLGLISLIFSKSYRGIADDRQVLILFNQEIDPNNQAIFILIGIAISLYYLMYIHKYIIMSMAIFIINSFSLLQTGSRGGLVSLAMIILYVVFFNEKKSMLSIIKKVFIIGIIGIILYYIVIKYLPESIYERLFDFSSYEGGSERDMLWRNVMELLLTDFNILFGVGWGGYYGYNGIYSVAHNTYLSMLSDVGIIGTLIFFIPIIKVCVYALKNKKNLPILILISTFFPSFFIDAINKRFFWNVIILALIFYKSYIENDNDNDNESSKAVKL